MLLIPLRQVHAMFIGATTKPTELDEMFLNRFGTKLSTSKPDLIELQAFIERRCVEFGLGVDHGEAVVSLAQRSHRIVGNVMSVLARAATRKPAMVTRTLVQEFEFYTEDIPDEEVADKT
jgi:Holliday junction resolvasome RuvABC ATP-dependent DNA helicase subunit